MTHRKLCELGAKWLFKNDNWHLNCPFVCCELVCVGGAENPDILGLRGTGSILIEVKVSRADFLRDKKKECRREDCHNAVGHSRYYLAPKGLIKVEELPGKWGLIEYDAGFEVVKLSESFKENHEVLHHYMLSILRREVGYKIFDYRNNKEKK